MRAVKSKPSSTWRSRRFPDRHIDQVDLKRFTLLLREQANSGQPVVKIGNIQGANLVQQIVISNHFPVAVIVKLMGTVLRWYAKWIANVLVRQFLGGLKRIVAVRALDATRGLDSDPEEVDLVLGPLGDRVDLRPWPFCDPATRLLLYHARYPSRVLNSRSCVAFNSAKACRAMARWRTRAPCRKHKGCLNVAACRLRMTSQALVLVLCDKPIIRRTKISLIVRNIAFVRQVRFTDAVDNAADISHIHSYEVAVPSSPEPGPSGGLAWSTPFGYSGLLSFSAFSFSIFSHSFRSFFLKRRAQFPPAVSSRHSNSREPA